MNFFVIQQGYWENHVLLFYQFYIELKAKFVDNSRQCLAFTPCVQFNPKFKCWQHLAGSWQDFTKAFLNPWYFITYKACIIKIGPGSSGPWGATTWKWSEPLSSTPFSGSWAKFSTAWVNFNDASFRYVKIFLYICISVISSKCVLKSSFHVSIQEIISLYSQFTIGLLTYSTIALTFSSVASDKQSIRKFSKIGRIDPLKNNLMNRLNK